MLALEAVIVIEATFEALTVSEVLPLTPPKLALIVACPSALVTRRPLSVTGAAIEFELCHCATPVMSWLVPSENVACALNCWVTLRPRTELAGVTVIAVGVAEVTVNVELAEIVPTAALMVAIPAEAPLARPSVAGEELIGATAGSDDVHAT